MSRRLRTVALASPYLLSIAALMLIAAAETSAQDARPAPAPESATPSPQPGAPLPEAALLIRKGAELTKANKLAEAEAAFVEALKTAERQQGEASLMVADVLSWLINHYKRQQRIDEMQAAADRMISILQQRLGEDDLRTLEMHRVLADIAKTRQRQDDVVAHLQKFLAGYDKRFSGGAPDQKTELIAVRAATDLARGLRFISRLPEAEAAL
jgi:hypothetical protein